MTIPVKLILTRILLIPIFLVLFWCDLRTPAIITFAVAALTDLPDGIIARKYNLSTHFVKLMDPLADKLLISAALIALVGTGQIAAWLAILIIGRDLLITGFRLFAATQGFSLGAVITGKINTALQMILILVVLAGFNFPILVWVVVGLTLVSTAENFIRNWNVIRTIKLK